MNVCLISSEYPTDHHGGGIGTYTEKTARALVGAGVDVAVITETEDVPSQREEEGVLVYRLANPERGRLRTLARSYAVDRAVRQLDRRPDIVQACEYGAEAAVFSLRPRRGTKLVTRLATPSFVVREVNAHGVTPGGVSRFQVDRLEKMQTRRSDGVISISRAITRVIADRWNIRPARITPMKTGVDFAARFAGSAAPLPKALEGQTYLLFFGRLEERKGVQVLADALPDVMALHPGIHMVFAGRPQEFCGRPMDEYVRSRNPSVPDRLHFLPHLPQADLYTLVDRARVIVLPSLWEGLGNVALEALDMGKPVVATSGSGFDDVIEDGRSGVLVPPGDVDALRLALLRVLGDETLLRRLAEEARVRARAFELGLVTCDLVRFYEGLLQRSSGTELSRR